MPNITFKRESEINESYTANWADANGRYHVWIRGKRPEDTIYMNPLQRPDGSYPKTSDDDHFRTRKLDLQAKKNSAIQREISVAIAKGALVDADKVRQAEKDANEAVQLAKLVIDRRRQLNHIANITKSLDLHHYLQNASDEQIAALPSLYADQK